MSIVSAALENNAGAGKSVLIIYLITLIVLQNFAALVLSGNLGILVGIEALAVVVINKRHNVGVSYFYKVGVSLGKLHSRSVNVITRFVNLYIRLAHTEGDRYLLSLSLRPFKRVVCRAGYRQVLLLNSARLKYKGIINGIYQHVCHRKYGNNERRYHTR